MSEINEKECIVCRRIDPKIIFKYAHLIFDSEHAHLIAKEACIIINQVDSKNRFFFCQKSYGSILSGLFYALQFKFSSINKDCKKPTIKMITQREIGSVFPSRFGTSGHLTEATVRNSFKRWIRIFPKLFPYLNAAEVLAYHFQVHPKPKNALATRPKKLEVPKRPKFFEGTIFMSMPDGTTEQNQIRSRINKGKDVYCGVFCLELINLLQQRAIAIGTQTEEECYKVWYSGALQSEIEKLIPKCLEKLHSELRKFTVKSQVDQLIIRQANSEKGFVVDLNKET